MNNKDVNEIRLKRKYCPVCKKELIDEDMVPDWSAWREHYCPSECYRYRTNHLYNITYIFNDKFVEVKGEARKYGAAIVENYQIRQQIREKISYWKENNRYVAELLLEFKRDPKI